MIDLDNQTTLSFTLAPLEEIVSSLSNKEVELIITNDKTMQALNSEHRGKATSTDVLSFPIELPIMKDSSFNMPLGSIVISETYVRERAKALGHTVQDELSLLFIHGMLHLLGFDHETDSGEMRQKEEALIKEFDLPKSLIVRTGE